MKRHGAFAALTCLLACSPALNWRDTALEDLQVQLPCKPDRASRDLTVGTHAVTIAMLGCEADGALFAVGRTQLAHPGDTMAVQGDWQTATLANMQSQAPQELPAQAPWPGGSAKLLTTHGTGPKPMQARLLWLARGNTIYHLAVYAPQLTPAMTEPFFASPRLMAP